MSQNERVNKMSFRGVLSHTFPNKWRESGVNLAKCTFSDRYSSYTGSFSDVEMKYINFPTVEKTGTSLNEFIEILNLHEIKYNIEDIPLSEHSGLEIVFRRSRLSFIVGSSEFEAIFMSMYEINKSAFSEYKYYEEGVGTRYKYLDIRYHEKFDLLEEVIEVTKGSLNKILERYCDLSENIGIIELNIVESY